jgi:homoserine dehydrogenase
MSSDKKIKIGLFGFGVVGQGIYNIISQQPELPIEIVKICVKDSAKQRAAPTELITTNKNELLQNSDIDLIVEVINNSDAALEIVQEAFANGKHVVSASKKMIAENLESLLEHRAQSNVSFLYEASACASIPLLRNLDEFYQHDNLKSLKGIVNGSTNYILTKIFEQNLSFEVALAKAQELGFAETDASLDVEGFDAKHKWIEVLLHAYGIKLKQEQLLNLGIQNIKKQDVAFAAKNNQTIKLIAYAKKINDEEITAFVLPQFVDNNSPLAFVKNEFNAVQIESNFAGEQVLYGRGAGSLPTATAVISDIIAVKNGYTYTYPKSKLANTLSFTNKQEIAVYVGFENLPDIPINEFSKIEKIEDSKEGKFIIGKILVSKLLEQQWWRKPSVSLITLAEPIAVQIKKEYSREKELAEVAPM